MIQKIVLFVLLFLSVFEVDAQESTASKQVTTLTVNALQLDTPRKIWLYLPKDYATSTKK